LGLALFHGLNGLRGILLEWRPLARRERLVTGALWLLGISAFGYGMLALWAFVK
jgi:succinate dehydrogenase/fumarate reductase cytochrome b subunit